MEDFGLASKVPISRIRKGPSAAFTGDGEIFAAAYDVNHIYFK